jgi:hypothetical protein
MTDRNINLESWARYAMKMECRSCVPSTMPSKWALVSRQNYATIIVTARMFGRGMIES